jgi:phage tail protein X
MKDIKIKSLVSLLLLLPLLFSCEDILDSKAGEVVEFENHYKNVYDADMAIWGLYGKLQHLAEQVVVLNELRADLMDITPNADNDLVELNNHTVSKGNRYAKVTPFYEVILNANDMIANFNAMLAKNLITAEDYAPRYADVVAVRCWTYLQLAIHFKNLPYITNPLVSVKELNKKELFPQKNLDELIPILIKEMESLASLEVNTRTAFYGKTITDNGRPVFLNMQFLNKRLLLGDLYLWNDQYVQAGIQYKAYMDADDVGSNKTDKNNKVSGWVWAGTNEPRFQIIYQRFKDQDVTAYRNMWKEIFSRSSTDAGNSTTIALQDEMIWMITFTGSEDSTSPFVRLFANTGQGEYLIQPSAYAIDSLWETQVQQSNGFVFDGRGRQSSFDHVDGQPVVLKYLYDYYNRTVDANRTIHLNYHSINNPYLKPGKWFLYRAGLLHLRYAEAANRAGYPHLAYALLNNGIRSNFDWPLSNGNYRADKEGVQYSSFPPANDSVHAAPYPEPFYLDARMNNAPYTFLRSPWRDHYGIRNRAFLVNAEPPVGGLSGEEYKDWMELALLREQALECGFEGHRWADMLRIARRRANRDPGQTALLLQEWLKGKFSAGGKGVPMLSGSNLFLEIH